MFHYVTAAADCLLGTELKGAVHVASCTQQPPSSLVGGGGEKKSTSNQHICQSGACRGPLHLQRLLWENGHKLAAKMEGSWFQTEGSAESRRLLFQRDCEIKRCHTNGGHQWLRISASNSNSTFHSERHFSHKKKQGFILFNITLHAYH